ncbi:transcriptional regulator GlxA family with amidase domain [Paraburkholderia sp. BL6665CI2N2]|uniref:helix-turn-helix domain-containing protein n=1 Tax=Paraburkholderia sp. BL6665CI2N2 TaxID=1938806 RepID=UPI0010652EE4|nr:helix-turn-helix domain-containing protein [Paraburkholderia sp. BL6665CI2N2]TDY16883.1 transcriptional regulator GlxA family with amidase domain [Paraburkholderia sp. BL6665CI2N2]
MATKQIKRRSVVCRREIIGVGEPLCRRDDGSRLDEPSSQDASHGVFPPRKIGALVFPGFSSLDLAFIAQVIQYANEAYIAGVKLGARYALSPLSANGGIVSSSSGISVFSEPASGIGADDLVIVLGGNAASPVAHAEASPTWLRGANVYCTVAEVVSGWQIAAAMDAESGRRRLPVRRDSRIESFRGEPEPMRRAEYMGDRKAGVGAALLIVRHDMGHATARKIGQRVLPGADRWLASLLGEPDDSSRAKVLQAARWIDENCERPISVDDVCAYASMTAWTLARHFRATTGMSPAGYLQKARFERACRLLAETHLPIDKVARRSGLSGGMALAKLFQRRLALSPGAYRRSLNCEQMISETSDGGGKSTAKSFAQ